ncbi:MAG: SDR family oxidoreductase [Lachnospiraceae bacterium]|nr:SDR family oxidoreductase [Lachnospiraceae bacterium]
MKKVAVFVGGGSGIGLATAKYMPKDKIIVLACRTESKLEDAVEQLKELGYEAYYKVCDIVEREQVKELAEYANTLGEITTVINSAGYSPAMAKGDPSILLKVNSLGTVHVNEEFVKYMRAGSVIVCMGSISAYQMPDIMVNKKSFPLAETDPELFIKKNMKLSKFINDEYGAAGVVYGASKSFVLWYMGKCALEYGRKKIRVVSVSPGFISTSMGELEMSQGGCMDIINNTAEGRMGTPEEAGYAVATIADERNSYLTGVDILLDGGFVLASKKK